MNSCHIHEQKKKTHGFYNDENWQEKPIIVKV